MSSREEVLQALIDKGADINEQTSQPIYIGSFNFVPAGFTPLMSAVFLNDTASVNLLLEKGADKHLKNAERKMAHDYIQDSEAGSKIKKLF